MHLSDADPCFRLLRLIELLDHAKHPIRARISRGNEHVVHFELRVQALNYLKCIGQKDVVSMEILSMSAATAHAPPPAPAHRLFAVAAF
jgi:hypothetical protein